MEYTERMKTAYDNFLAGYNCTQSVMLAFSDLTHLDKEASLKIASSFGGGMARMREVCGAISGIFMVAGYLYGYSSPDDKEGKKAHYAFLRKLAQDFKDVNGSIVCKELLKNIQVTSGGEPEERTPEYYKKRPCAEIIAQCTGILEKAITQREQE